MRFEEALAIYHEAGPEEVIKALCGLSNTVDSHRETVKKLQEKKVFRRILRG